MIDENPTDEMTAEERSAAQRGAVRDVSRLINLGDVIYQAGTLLYRRALRLTMLTAGIGLLGYLANFAGVAGFSVKQALALPLLVGGGMLIGKLLLRTIPAVIASRQMMIAQANDLNLMEDYRKSEANEHLAALWERVYRYEWAFRSREAGTTLPSDEGRQEFFVLAYRCLDSHMTQPRERFELGIDLHHYEDWRDGAYFDRSDIKLVEQYEGDTTLTAVKREAGVGVLAGLAQLPTRLLQHAWFALITRAVARHIADAVDRLNREHRTEVFNSQVLIWPGEQDAPWLEQFPGAREEILRRRHRLMDRVFGPDRASARNLLDRMFAPNFELATRLRLLYDPEYCLGNLEYDVLLDLSAAEHLQDRRLVRHAEKFAARARKELAHLQTRLEKDHTELLAPERAEDLRSVRIAFHTDRDHAKRRLLAAVAKGAADEALEAVTAPLVRAAVEDREHYSRRLLGLRQHHELTRLERLSYYKLVDALWPAPAELAG